MGEAVHFVARCLELHKDHFFDAAIHNANAHVAASEASIYGHRLAGCYAFIARVTGIEEGCILEEFQAKFSGEIRG